MTTSKAVVTPSDFGSGFSINLAAGSVSIDCSSLISAKADNALSVSSSDAKLYAQPSSDEVPFSTVPNPYGVTVAYKSTKHFVHLCISGTLRTQLQNGGVLATIPSTLVIGLISTYIPVYRYARATNSSAVVRNFSIDSRGRIINTSGLNFPVNYFMLSNITLPRIT